MHEKKYTRRLNLLHKQNGIPQLKLSTIYLNSHISVITGYFAEKAIEQSHFKCGVVRY